MPLPISSGNKVKLPEGRGLRLDWVKELLSKVDYARDDEEECYLLLVDYLPPAHARLPGLGTTLQDARAARDAFRVLAQSHEGERSQARLQQKASALPRSARQGGGGCKASQTVQGNGIKEMFTDEKASS